jgi:hypothetical protein
MRGYRPRVLMPTLLTMLLFASSTQAADFEKEFLNKPWGAPVSDFPGYRNVGGSGQIKYYVNPKQAYTILGVHLTNFVFGFYEDKFFAAYATLGAIDSYGAIKHQLQQRLGVPKISMESQGGLTTYSWKTGETRIKMKYHDISGAMKMSFYYLPIASQVNAERQKEVEDEPPEPPFPLNEFRRKEAVQQQVQQLDVFNQSTY